MMGRQDGQLKMIVVDLSVLIPKHHLLKQIDQMVSFKFIYDIMTPHYSNLGRRSIDPLNMIKRLLVGYLFGIASERRLVQEIQLNIAYRWFCGFGIDDEIPEHSVFSQNRRRKWKNSDLFEQIFVRIVRACIEKDLIDGEKMVADGSFVPSNVSRSSWIDVERNVTKSMQSYLNVLDDELASQPGFKKPPERTVVQKHVTSSTDPDSGYICQPAKKGIGYLLESTVDTKHGIVTGIDVYPANERESLKILRHLEKQQKGLDIQFKNIALDRGYDTGAVHRGLELLPVSKNRIG
jgi:Transposase and inactivated derivatives